MLTLIILTELILQNHTFKPTINKLSSHLKKDDIIHLDSKSEGAIVGEIKKVVIWNEILVLLTSETQNPVKIFNGHGHFLGTVSRTGKGVGEYSDAIDIEATADKILVLSNIDGKIYQFDKNRKFTGFINIRSKDFHSQYSVAKISYFSEIGLILFDSYFSDRKSFYGIIHRKNSNIPFYNPKYKINSSNSIGSSACGIWQGNLIFASSMTNAVDIFNRAGILNDSIQFSNTEWSIPDFNTLNEIAKIIPTSSKSSKLDIFFKNNHILEKGIVIRDFFILDYGDVFISINLKSKEIKILDNDIGFYSTGMTDGKIIFTEETNSLSENPSLVVYSWKAK